jgi:hypothetical protein
LNTHHAVKKKNEKENKKETRLKTT